MPEKKSGGQVQSGAGHFILPLSQYHHPLGTVPFYSSSLKPLTNTYIDFLTNLLQHVLNSDQTHPSLFKYLYVFHHHPWSKLGGIQIHPQSYYD